MRAKVLWTHPKGWIRERAGPYMVLCAVKLRSVPSLAIRMRTDA